MTDRELLQQALDALAQSWVNDHHGNRKQVLATCADDFEKPFEAMLALRKRLAQCDRCGEVNPAEIHTCTPAYVDRRQWLYDPMTGEPLIKGWPLYSGLPQPEQCTRCGKVNSAEIHTCTPKKQEPGAVDSDKVICPSCCQQFRAIPVNVQKLMLAAGFEPPLTSPPQREWVGLMDEEIRDAYGSVCGKEWCIGGMDNAEVFYDAIEAKLKEKNG